MATALIEAGEAVTVVTRERAHADPWAAWVQARFPEGAALHSLEPEEPEGADPLAQLTLTEQQVAGLVADGASNREIAQRLHLSVKTVEGTLTRIWDGQSRITPATTRTPWT